MYPYSTRNPRNEQSLRETATSGGVYEVMLEDLVAVVYESDATRTPDNSRVSRKHYPDKNGPRRGPVLETIRTKMGQNGHQPGNFARTNRLLRGLCWNAVRTNVHGGRLPGLA